MCIFFVVKWIDWCYWVFNEVLLNKFSERYLREEVFESLKGWNLLCEVMFNNNIL